MTWAARRWGIIGSAASAVQIAPEIAQEVGQLHVFQRTAHRVLPKEDDPYTPEEMAARRADPSIVVARRDELFNQVDTGMAFKNAKVRAGMEETGLEALEAVTDPELRAKLTPDHPWGCKRRCSTTSTTRPSTDRTWSWSRIH